MEPIYIVIGVGVLLFLYLIGTYNFFVTQKTRIEEALSGIDIQLKRRIDLIPNLIETVRGYVKHERETFDSVTRARSALVKAENLHEKAEANNQLTSALKTLFAVAEDYPDLKASSNFQELQRQLEDTEDKIAYSRQFYNTNVLDYNTKLRVFPSNLLGNAFGFKETEFFESEEEAKKAIKVKF